MTIYSLDVLLSQFGTSHYSLSSSNCCFLTCIQISQEAGKIVWYSHLFKNFPQFLVTFLPHLPFSFSSHFLALWFFSFTPKFLSLHILGCWFTLKTEAPGEMPETQHHPVHSQLLCWVRWPQAPLLTGDVTAEWAGFHHSELPVIPGLLMSGSECQEQCCGQNFPQQRKCSFSAFLLY